MYSIPSSAVVADSPCNAAVNNGEKCQSFNVRKGTTNKSEKTQKAANLPDRTREQESSATDQSEQGKEMGQLEGGERERRGDSRKDAIASFSFGFDFGDGDGAR